MHFQNAASLACGLLGFHKMKKEILRKLFIETKRSKNSSFKNNLRERSQCINNYESFENTTLKKEVR